MKRNHAEAAPATTPANRQPMTNKTFRRMNRWAIGATGPDYRPLQVLDDLTGAVADPDETHRLIRRTERRGHYRFPEGLAEIMGIRTSSPAGAHRTEPPTELVTVHDALMGIEGYVKESGLSADQIIAGIRQGLAFRQEATDQGLSEASSVAVPVSELSADLVDLKAA